MALIAGRFTLRAGQALRLAKGRGRSGNEDGPIHDLQDFRFVDGSSPPETAKQRWWKNKRQRETERIQKIREDMDVILKKEKELFAIAQKTEDEVRIKTEEALKKKKEAKVKKNTLVADIIEKLEKKKQQQEGEQQKV
eukprot:TRINITY_DN2831_c0_g1_i2.p1 TRINITY_DN2831_c0_g1~~TRINITY_DN2831_c0_g1_i2.p1  ORF type:complete len:138 (-),score=60.58 TRINITY_DN2831_c0_g1_i2:148-561(-)